MVRALHNFTRIVISHNTQLKFNYVIKFYSLSDKTVSLFLDFTRSRDLGWKKLGWKHLFLRELKQSMR